LRPSARARAPTAGGRARAQVGWFLHTPFPSSEIYRTLPVREEVLRAVLKADLIGFHTYDYARHFVSACTRILGLEARAWPAPWRRHVGAGACGACRRGRRVPGSAAQGLGLRALRCSGEVLLRVAEVWLAVAMRLCTVGLAAGQRGALCPV